MSSLNFSFYSPFQVENLRPKTDHVKPYLPPHISWMLQQLSQQHNGQMEIPHPRRILAVSLPDSGLLDLMRGKKRLIKTLMSLLMYEQISPEPCHP